MSKMYPYYNALKVEGLRQCTICLMQKSEDEFSRAISKLKNTGLCRECKRVKDKADYRKHRDKRLAQYKKYAEANYEKVRKINKLAVNKRRFGIDRNKLITEDSICSNCGMTQEEHLDRYSLSLNIHHIDGNGRHAEKNGMKPNNDPKNLQLLCQSCHTKEHNLKRVNRTYSSNMYKKIWKTRRARAV